MKKPTCSLLSHPRPRTGFHSGTTGYLAIGFTLLCALTTVVLACQVPVFRYALERWYPDFYEVVIVSDGELSGEQQAVADFLEETSMAMEEDDLQANIRVTLVTPEEFDLGEDGPKFTGDDLPRIVLLYPRMVRQFIKQPVWTGPLTMENAHKLVRSPVRDELVKRILAGDSAVWLLVESGNKEKDDAAEKSLIAFSGEARDMLEIPEGVIGPGDMPPPGQPLSPMDAENILQSEVPLKIDFSTIRVSREDAREEILLSMLLKIEDDLGEYADEPIVYPVFGRGRILQPLVGAGLNRDNVLFDSSYLCGACSCQVKEQNPGVDLLFAANWDAAIMGSEIILDKILPPLEGAAALVQAPPTENADANPDNTTVEAASPPVDSNAPAPDTPSDPATTPSEESQSGASPFQILAAVIGLVFLGIVFATLKIRKKTA